MTEEFEDHPMTEDEKILFDEWNRFVDRIARARPRIGEMAALCGKMAVQRAGTARALKVAYNQPFNQEMAREVIIFDALEKLLSMIESQSKNLPKGIQMAI